MLTLIKNILKTFIILIFSLTLLKYFSNITEKFIEKNIKDKTVYNFIINILKLSLYLILVIIFLESVNIKTSPLVTILGTISITIGLSLKNSLSNLSSGILIIVLKFFKIGDKIEVDKKEGIVKNIQIFNTILESKNKNLIIIPNNIFLSKNITNFNTKEKIKNMEILLLISKDNNIIKKKNIINKILNKFIKIKKICSFNLNINNITNKNIEFLIKIFFKNKKNNNIKSEILENFIKMINYKKLNL